MLKRSKVSIALITLRPSLGTRPNVVSDSERLTTHIEERSVRLRVEVKLNYETYQNSSEVQKSHCSFKQEF